MSTSFVKPVLHYTWVVSVLLLLVLVLASFDQPVKHDRSYYEQTGEIVWEVPMKEKLIALTFDDGPDPKTTPLILDLLQQYDAKGTFFVIGYRLDQYPDLVRREIEELHEVANHTNLHPYFEKNVNRDMVAKEIQSLASKFKAFEIPESPWFRPPGGYYNDVVIEAAKALGYHVVLWSWHQDTRDWSKPGVDKIVSKVLNNARNGDIVLMHDHVNGSMETVKALAIILPELKRRGFRMVTISELLNHGDVKQRKKVSSEFAM